MTTTINLDRSIPIYIKYPFGVDETITFTYNDVETLTSTYQIVIVDNSGVVVETITESDPQFGKATNVLTWNINYETDGALNEGQTYQFEIQDTTNDYRIFYGTLELKHTL